jgi:hypothetical protein
MGHWLLNVKSANHYTVFYYRVNFRNFFTIRARMDITIQSLVVPGIVGGDLLDLAARIITVGRAHEYQTEVV